jgi:hypothetical protein
MGTTTASSVNKVVEVEEFDRIVLRGPARLNIEQTGETRVQAVGQVQVIEDLVIESSDGVLYIETDPDHAAADLVIHLLVDQLREIFSVGAVEVLVGELNARELALEGRGSGHYELRGLHVDDLFVVGNGSTEFQLSGEAKRQVVDLAGVGRYYGGNLATQTSEVNVRGSGDVALWVEAFLDVNIVGSGKVEYSGAPIVLQQIFGSGAVARTY